MNANGIDGGVVIVVKNKESFMRTGVIAIIVTDTNAVPRVQQQLTAHSQIIVGRMGIPDHENAKNIIALIVKGEVEQISSLTGSLGRISGVHAKSVLAE